MHSMLSHKPPADRQLAEVNQANNDCSNDFCVCVVHHIILNMNI